MPHYNVSRCLSPPPLRLNGMKDFVALLLLPSLLPKGSRHWGRRCLKWPRR